MWKKRYKASYTVEASYIMAIVIFALAVLIRSSYAQCQETTGQLKLHHMVYQLRGQETGEEMDFAVGQWDGSVKRERNLIKGRLHGDGWNREIEVQVHAPEEMMRRMTIFQPDGQGEEVWTK